MLIDFFEILYTSAELYLSNIGFVQAVTHDHYDLFPQLLFWILMTLSMAYGLGKVINPLRFPRFHLRFNKWRAKVAFLFSIVTVICLVAHPVLPIIQTISMHIVLSVLTGLIAICCFPEFLPLIDRIKQLLIVRNNIAVLWMMVLVPAFFLSNLTGRSMQRYNESTQQMFVMAVFIFMIVILLPVSKNFLRGITISVDHFAEKFGNVVLSIAFYIVPLIPLFVPQIYWSGDTYIISAYDHILVSFCLFMAFSYSLEGVFLLTKGATFVLIMLMIGNSNAVIWDIVVWFNQLEPTLQYLFELLEMPLVQVPDHVEPISDPVEVEAFWDDMMPSSMESMMVQGIFSLTIYCIIVLNLLLPGLIILPLYPENKFEGQTLQDILSTHSHHSNWGQYWTLSYPERNIEGSMELFFLEDGWVVGTHREPVDDEIIELNIYGKYKEHSGRLTFVQLWSKTTDSFAIRFDSTAIFEEENEVEIEGFWVVLDIDAGHFQLRNRYCDLY